MSKKVIISPVQLFGAMVTDGAPEDLSLNLAKACAEITKTGTAEQIDKWRTITFEQLLGHGYEHAAMVAICSHTPGAAPYEQRGREYLAKFGVEL